jgi:hypothetical protein
MSNERDLFIEIMKTNDALEGATAFAEKPPGPQFQRREGMAAVARSSDHL